MTLESIKPVISYLARELFLKHSCSINILEKKTRGNVTLFRIVSRLRQLLFEMEELKFTSQIVRFTFKHTC